MRAYRQASGRRRRRAFGKPDTDEGSLSAGKPYGKRAAHAAGEPNGRPELLLLTLAGLAIFARDLRSSLSPDGASRAPIVFPIDPVFPRPCGRARVTKLGKSHPSGLLAPRELALPKACLPIGLPAGGLLPVACRRLARQVDPITPRPASRSGRSAACRPAHGSIRSEHHSSSRPPAVTGGCVASQSGTGVPPE